MVNKMVEIKGNKLVFSFPEVHPNAVFTVTLHRTLRIPDDGKKYNLPPSLGAFPVKHVDDYEKVPKKWKQHGGVMVPMYQSEAMWLRFECDSGYPFAVKVATGKRNAINGKEWKKNLTKDDYLICPDQPWLDGYVVADGVIRQFIAAPLGKGFTAEEQITGKSEFAGLQIEVYPMNADSYSKLITSPRLNWTGLDHLFIPLKTNGIHETIYKIGDFPNFPNTLYGSSISSVDVSNSTMNEPVMASNSVLRSTVMKSSVGPSLRRSLHSSDEHTKMNEISEVGLAPGGSMNQEVYKDKHGLDKWTQNSSRCFIHLLNSESWRIVTGEAPPTKPLSAADYSKYGMVWYEYYSDQPTQSNPMKNSVLKGVAELEKKKRVKVLPENHSIPVPDSKKKQIRDGVWKL